MVCEDEQMNAERVMDHATNCNSVCVSCRANRFFSASFLFAKFHFLKAVVSTASRFCLQKLRLILADRPIFVPFACIGDLQVVSATVPSEKLSFGFFPN
jgi:hypothetical protein